MLIYCTYTYRICRNKRPGLLVFKSKKKNSATHKNPSVLCTPPFEKSSIKNPSVLCTPPFEKSSIQAHRFHVLPPLKDHCFWWAIISGWAFISANTVYVCTVCTITVTLVPICYWVVLHFAVPRAVADEHEYRLMSYLLDSKYDYYLPETVFNNGHKRPSISINEKGNEHRSDAVFFFTINCGNQIVGFTVTSPLFSFETGGGGRFTRLWMLRSYILSNVDGNWLGYCDGVFSFFFPHPCSSPDYNKAVRPAKNHTESLTVTFGVALTQLIDVVRCCTPERSEIRWQMCNRDGWSFPFIQSTNQPINPKRQMQSCPPMHMN